MCTYTHTDKHTHEHTHKHGHIQVHTQTEKERERGWTEGFVIRTFVFEQRTVNINFFQLNIL